MNKLVKVSVGLSLVALVVGGLAFVRPLPAPQAGVQGEKGAKGDKGDRGEQGLRGLVGPAGKNGESLGAVTGPDFLGPYQALNNVQTFAESKRFNTASSTLCSYIAVATSTIGLASARLDNSSTTANIFLEIGVGAIETDATSTSLSTSWISANEATGDLSLLIASSTLGNGTATSTNQFVVSPGQTVNVKAAAKNADLAQTDALGLSGTCKVELKGL